MAIQYNGYKYVGQEGEEIDPTKNYQFDNNYVSQLCASHRYREAYNYYKKFDFSDNFELQQQVWNKMDELDEAAKKDEALYYRIEDKRTISNIRFTDAVMQQGGVESMRFQKDDRGNYLYATDEDFNKENPIAGQFRTMWNRLGSTGVRTVSMDVSIPKIKRGSGGGDWSVKDIDDDAEIFATLKSKYGLTRDDIESSGILRDTSDIDNVKYKVPKDSQYAIQFMYSVAAVESKYMNWFKRNNLYDNHYNDVKIIGYDVKGNRYEPYSANKNYNYGSAYANPYAGQQPPNITDVKDYRYDIFELARLIDKADGLKANATSKIQKQESIETSGTKFQLSMIKTATDKQFVIDYCKTHALSSSHERYLATNGGVLQKSTKEKDYEDFMRNFAARSANQIEIEGYTNNGLTGILITLNPVLDNKTGKGVGDIQQMFIPNYMMQVVGYDMNKRTDIKALQEVANMQSYGSGYKYVFDDGSVAFIDEGGKIRRRDANQSQEIIDDLFDSRERLLRDIDRDYILKHANREVIRFTNSNGEIDRKILDKYAKTVASSAIEELYSATLNRDISGNEIDFENLFTNRAAIQETLDSNYNLLVKQKLEDMYAIYDNIIKNALSNYKPINE